MIHNYRKQLRTVLVIEALLLLIGIIVAVSFWSIVCSDSVSQCVNKTLSLPKFFLFSLIRPFVFTPLAVLAYMAGNAYGSFGGALLTALGGSLSCAILLIGGKILGKKLVAPWLSSNLPQTFFFLKSQDWKIVLGLRLVPLLPFDLLTLLFGILDFKWKRVVLFTFLGSIPEAYIITEIANPGATIIGSTFMTVITFCLFFLLPGIMIEYFYRKKGTSLWFQLALTWKEIHHEIIMNNTIVKRQSHNPKKLPILLVYGFFSSRKSLTILERILTFRGYEVFSFNLGGLLGIFFTKSITETAEYVDQKLKRQFERYNFDQIQIVAHSKGGLVALWWLLKLGGHKYCRKVVTMGTPFQGSLYTWLGIVTPLGFFLKDLWQMRPGSSFLREINSCPIPPELEIHNLYSLNDSVARGKLGLYKKGDTLNGKIKHIPMHHISHFEFLSRRDVGDVLTQILGSPYLEDHTPGKISDPPPLETAI